MFCFGIMVSISFKPEYIILRLAAGILICCIAGLVPYGLLAKTKGHRKTKIGVNVPQGRSNWFASFWSCG